MTEKLRIITNQRMDQEFLDYLQGIRNRNTLIVTDPSKPRPLRERAFAEFKAITAMQRGVKARMNR